MVWNVENQDDDDVDKKKEEWERQKTTTTPCMSIYSFFRSKTSFNYMMKFTPTRKKNTVITIVNQVMQRSSALLGYKRLTTSTPCLNEVPM